MTENLVEVVTKVITDNYVCRHCEFWDHDGYCCFLSDKYPKEIKCSKVDSLLTLLSQHGCVQLDENQDFAPFAGIPSAFYRVRPLEGK